MTDERNDLPDHITLTRDIVSTFAANNFLSALELVTLITETHMVLTQLASPPVPEPIERPTPAVAIRKSITADYLVCLEDGKQFKSLKRHLRTRYNLTPEEYRARWNLASDYPMVAPGYASERSQLAKAMGFGKDRRGAAAE